MLIATLHIMASLTCAGRALFRTPVSRQTSIKREIVILDSTFT